MRETRAQRTADSLMFTVRITGPGIDFHMAISCLEDIEIAMAVLAKVRAALSADVGAK